MKKKQTPEQIAEERAFLKSKGWHRGDRTSQGHHNELWSPPWNGLGYAPLSMSRESALKRQRKEDAKQENRVPPTKPPAGGT